MQKQVAPPRLFHISEEPGINVFHPRPPPSFYDQITGDVVFAVSDQLLHNYLLPRDCPRISFYKNKDTTPEDTLKFFGSTNAGYVLTIESSWYTAIQQTKLYCYEFPTAKFALLDECAGYYISYKTIEPIATREINDPVAELIARGIEIRFTPNLWKLAEALKASTLNYSMIRMRNAAPSI